MEQEPSSSIRSKEFERPSIRTQHLAELVCPVCYEYMQPPIMMCERSHSICALCHELMSNCPQCNGELTYRRSSALEKLTTVMLFPCKHCNIRYSLEDLETHNCFQASHVDHSPTATCIIGQVYGDCLWSGPSNEMLDHCAKQHPHNFWTMPENMALWKYADIFNVGVQNIYVVDLSPTTFVIVQKYNSHTSTLCWNVSCECTTNRRYDYEIQIYDDVEYVLTKRTQIENAFSIMTFFPSGNEITIELDKVSKYLNENNVLKYKVVIFTRDDASFSHVVNINSNSVKTNKHSDNIIDKPSCISKAWNSVMLFYNSVKKYFHFK